MRRRCLPAWTCRASAAVLLLSVTATLVLPGLARAQDVEGLVVYFPFDEGVGASVSDPRGTGHVGAMLGDVTWSNGQYGGGVDFGGEDGYIRVPHHADFNFTEGVTVAAWIRPTLTLGIGIWQIIAAKGQDTEEFFEVLINPGGLVWMAWRLSEKRITPEQSPKLIRPKEWQHVAVSYQIDEWWTVYLNGEVLIDHDDQGQNLVPNTDDLLLGAEEPLDLKWFYSGEMDEFVLYDRGLTQTEIKAVQRGVEDLLVDAEGMSPTRWSVLKAQYTR
ncbi:LamG domain-containing protein [Candidatus Poribacteria bacterium]|jgi:hypothetical protein|nr:LamG domain-containing protein [Candidatus Poribacteria bacterium]MBT5537193.1 LamG domain-containing protein [Candidatus Poribacteria bacterium]MBT5709844.1 LamG domain-containing protein [Candidatus Poribacteria bacterium]MBT7101133.1 LamG domain-containing protein [Candidatus Poribacteria bacterium]MBT7809403.1 LamG domain-containing protein [Candidatus Poribacteria bacterium]